MNVMTYQGYAARIEYSAEDDCFVGQIAGITDVVGFHGESVAEMKQAFHEAVDDYLATCERIGKAAQKPFSGKVMLRIPPAVHARAAMLAQASGRSLNQWAAEVFARAA